MLRPLVEQKQVRWSDVSEIELDPVKSRWLRRGAQTERSPAKFELQPSPTTDRHQPKCTARAAPPHLYTPRPAESALGVPSGLQASVPRK